MERSKGKSIILTVTNKCNLQCIYCYEEFKDDKIMSLDTAKEILTREFDENQGEELEIDFHGGEPLLAYKLIKDLCEWTFAKKQGCKYRFFLTTNGTILTDEMKQWFALNKERVILSVSLDGNRSMHNRNRCNSFDKIDLDFFRVNWPKQHAKMTISEQTIADIADGVIFLHNAGFEVLYNLAFGINWSPNQINVYKEQIDKLTEFYIENPSIPRALNLQKKLRGVLSTAKVVRDCGSGSQMKGYDTNGNVYPCHMFAENALDQDFWDKLRTTDFTNDDLFADEECDNCPIYKLCPTCYGLNYKERGDVGKRDKRLCEFNKIEMLAMCKLRSHDLINKEIADFTQDDYMDLKAVKFLYQSLL